MEIYRSTITFTFTDCTTLNKCAPKEGTKSGSASGKSSNFRKGGVTTRIDFQGCKDNFYLALSLQAHKTRQAIGQNLTLASQSPTYRVPVIPVKPIATMGELASFCRACALPLQSRSPWRSSFGHVPPV